MASELFEPSPLAQRVSREQQDVRERDLGFGTVVGRDSRQRLLNRDGSFNVVRRGLAVLECARRVRAASSGCALQSGSGSGNGAGCVPAPASGAVAGESASAAASTSSAAAAGSASQRARAKLALTGPPR